MTDKPANPAKTIENFLKKLDDLPLTDYERRTIRYHLENVIGRLK